MDIRVGHGYDVHKLVNERKLFLGGVTVPYDKGLLGQSDADVLLHAICDALLGAAALGDIGRHFPDNDNSFKDIDSRVLLRRTVEMLKAKDYEISNFEATIIMQRPKLAPYIPIMADNVAADCGLATDRVNIKATTEEKLGFTGSGEGAAAHAVCIIIKK